MENKILDPILPDDIVLKIANQYVKAQHVTGIEESGGEARVYYLDNKYICKVQRPHRVRTKTSLQREVLFLNELKPFSEVTVPTVFGYGKENGEQLEFIIMSRMPGTAMRLCTIPNNLKKEILFNLGKQLYFIHHLPDEDKLLKSNLFPVDNDVNELKKRLLNPLVKHAEKIKSNFTDWPLKHSPDDIIETVTNNLVYDERKPLHSNPALSHTFVDPEHYSFTGLIDFGDSYFSHPANDLIRFLNHQDRADLFLGYNSLKKADDSFLRNWIVSQIVSDLKCIANDLQYKNESIKNIEKLLTKI